MARKRTCQNCRHFWRMFNNDAAKKTEAYRQGSSPSASSGYKPSPLGECRRNPPIPRQDGGRIWPVTSLIECCGEHTWEHPPAELDTQVRREVISELGLDPIDPDR